MIRQWYGIAKSTLLSSRVAVSRYAHSQNHISQSHPEAQRVQGHKLSVSRVENFRYVSAAASSSVEPHGPQNSRRDVIVCIGWMGCKEKHLDNVARLWLSLSPMASIITYKPSPFDVLWPRRGVQTAERIVASLPHGCRVVVHGFSTGGYLYSLMMHSFVSAIRSHRCKVSGCVFDCAVDMEGIPDGMANAVSQHKLVQAIVRSMTSMYLSISYAVITHMYIKASDLFKNPPAELQVPILVLAGGNDSIASVSTQEKVVLGWKSQGIPCSIKIFDGSKHCQLIVHSPQRYLAELRDFFASIDSPLGCFKH